MDISCSAKLIFPVTDFAFSNKLSVLFDPCLLDYLDRSNRENSVVSVHSQISRYITNNLIQKRNTPSKVQKSRVQH